MLSYERIGLRHIEAFFYAAKKGSFTKAAQELGVSQPTISGNIAALEQALGTSLFERKGKRVLLTEAGKIYFDYCEKMVRLREEALFAIEEFIGLSRGTLSLGASNIPAVYILPKVISRFRNEFPKVVVKMRVGDSAEIERGVLEGEFHLGFIGRMPEDKALSGESFAEDEVVLAVSPNSPYAKEDTISIKQLAEVPLVFREEGSATLEVFRGAIKRHKISEDGLNIVAVLGSTESVKRAVREGVGVGVVSLISIEDELELGVVKVIRIEGIKMSRKFFWVYRTSGFLPPAARKLVKMLRTAASFEK
jgi:DNA-binding transcriptional LysR family regulator